MNESSRESAQKGQQFLCRIQRENGSFPDFLGVGADLHGVVFEELSVFSCAIVLASMLDLAQANLDSLRERGLGYLQSQAQLFDSWSFWDARHPLSRLLWVDVDDTALISTLLIRYGRSRPRNLEWMMANRDPQGTFYTWVAPRWNLRAPLQWWILVLLRLRNPWKSWKFWSKASAKPQDRDSVVNANVLLYLSSLGVSTEAARCSHYLLSILREHQEHTKDKWYHGPWSFYYSLARAIKNGAVGLEEARILSIPRILKQQRSDGRIGENTLDTALALSALRWWDYQGEEIDRGRSFLAREQRSAGDWERSPIYFTGPDKKYCWGSEAVTTALCVEALTR